MKKVQEAQLSDRAVLLLVDYNVAMEGERLSTTFKIDSTLDTISYIREQGPRVLFILTHLGRPKGRDEYSVNSIGKYLLTRLPGLQSVSVDCYSGKERGVLFGDNMRYYTKEQLTTFYGKFDTIVNDAFGTAHRPMHCTGYAGLLMQKEIEALSQVKECDLLIMGGAKAKEKKELVSRFPSTVFLGGVLAYVAWKGQGHTMGIPPVPEISKVQMETSERIKLPVDSTVKTKDGEYVVKKIPEILASDSIVDLGTESVELLRGLVAKATLIFWNGPLGKFEDRHANSTRELVEMLSDCDARVVAGGGETLLAIERYSSVDRFYHVSTGGGAMLSYLGGEEMPGISGLE